MTKSKFFIPLLFLGVMISMNSCIPFVMIHNASAGRTKNTVEMGAIPYDFGEEKTVILCVLAQNKRVDKYIKKNFSKHYFGKYEFVLRENLHHKKYKDQTKYRYIFDHEKDVYSYQTSNYSTQAYAGGTRGVWTTRNSTGVAYTFLIEDRKEGLFYKSPLKVTSAFNVLLRTYIKNMEKERLKYQH